MYQIVDCSLNSNLDVMTTKLDDQSSKYFRFVNVQKEIYAKIIKDCL